MIKKYKLKNIIDESIIELTVTEILEEINRDRSEDWSNYDVSDWKEGLEEFTEYRLL